MKGFLQPGQPDREPKGETSPPAPHTPTPLPGGISPLSSSCPRGPPTEPGTRGQRRASSEGHPQGRDGSACWVDPGQHGPRPDTLPHGPRASDSGEAQPAWSAGKVFAAWTCQASRGWPRPDGPRAEGPVAASACPPIYRRGATPRQVAGLQPGPVFDTCPPHTPGLRAQSKWSSALPA